jgi:holo-[acyl-carrier protein] synthase
MKKATRNTMLYHGIDLVEVERVRGAVERWGERFLRRVFTAQELADCAAPGPHPRYESLAARWAAKEATAKALGIGLTGLGAEAIPSEYPRAALHDIEVVRAPDGRPTLHLHGALAPRIDTLDVSLSLSHTAAYAVASVVAIER